MNKSRFGWMRRYNLALVAGLLAASSLVLAACPADDSSGGGGGGEIETLRIGIPADITSQNPWAIVSASNTYYNVQAFINRYPTLMTYADQRFDWVPELADKLPGDVVEETGGGYSVTATLRDGATWSDGEAIDANDIEFTVNTFIELEISYDNVNQDFVTRAEAVDDLTVKYYFQEQDDDGNYRKPGLAIWQFGLSLAPVFPEHYWSPILDEIKAANADVADQRKELTAVTAITAGEEPSGGPAVFSDYQSGAFIGLERNETSYVKGSSITLFENGAYSETNADGEELVLYGTGEGETILEVERDIDAANTIFSVYGTQDAAILALRSGEIDYFMSPLGLSVGLQAQLRGATDVEVFENPSNGFRYLAFNTQRKPFDDIAFREAVATLIDKEFLATSVLQGAVSPIYSVVPEGNGFWYNDDVTQIGAGLTREERIDRVVTLLTGAGYSWTTQPSWNEDQRRVDEGEGLMDPDGNVIDELELISPSPGYDPLRASAAIWIEQWLNEAGIPTRANLTGFNEIVERIFEDPARDFDMWILGWGLTPYPAHLESFFSEARTAEGGNNAGGYVNEDYEEMLADFLAATEIDDARTLAFSLQEHLSTDLPYVTLFATPIREGYRSSELQFAYTDVLDGIGSKFEYSSGQIASISSRN